MEPSPHPFDVIPGGREELYQFNAGRRRLADAMRRLDAGEARFVRVAVNHCRCRPRLHAFNGFLNMMGNGWLYVPVAVLVPLVAGLKSWHFMLSAAVSVILSHSFYRLLKLRLARLRPCDFDPTLDSGIKALDKYSCPSGHCMTAAAVGVPLALAFPATLPAAALLWLLIAWSRVSLGHHYPTDLILGGLIGAGIALSVSKLIL